jgi:probable HAF family extracellular repeat protein
MRRFICLILLSLLLGTLEFALAEPRYTFTTLDVDVPGSALASVTGINDVGQIVGTFDDANVVNWERGFVWRDGHSTTLDVPDSAFTLVTGINNTGQIVGDFYDGSSFHGFVWRDGHYTTLDVPGSSFTSARGINDAGQIAGDFYDAIHFASGGMGLSGVAGSGRSWMFLSASGPESAASMMLARLWAPSSPQPVPVGGMRFWPRPYSLGISMATARSTTMIWPSCCEISTTRSTPARAGLSATWMAMGTLPPSMPANFNACAPAPGVQHAKEEPRCDSASASSW